MTFVGEYEHTLDAKNRVFMPARFREQLGESFFVTRKMNKNCLAVYTTEKMDQIADLINGFPDSEVSEIKEFLFSKSVQASPDSNGRIVLPQQILDYASIERDVVIIGAGDHIQIWSASLWHEAEKVRDIDKIRRKLASIGL
ncbi:MAG: division/cell wall cluster transcriptional repressor MraZ [Clostridia bacterium]|nr:division/cell wall cluster transcriptional repressor MraZ [Clostridia bacterium]